MGEILEAADFLSLREGGLTAVYPKGLPVLLIRKDAQVYALENRCAHMGCPLTAGKLEGNILQCPCHDWSFDIRDGRFTAAPEISVKTYATEIRDGKILVRL